MLKEALEFLLTPTTPLARRYGFLYQSISLKHRYNRCKKIWLPHLKNCQDLFLESIQSLPQKNHVVILGSAHLHEIPMHLLVQNFKKVTLVDVIHPLKHHLLAKKNKNLELITKDLSGALAELEEIETYEELLTLAKQLHDKNLFHFKADLIVSGNLLSQLALLPIEQVEKELKRPLTLEEKDQICTQFGNNHLKNLTACAGHKLVYCDREITYRSPDREVIYQGSYPIDFSGFTYLRNWMWELAPKGEASKDYSIEMKVEAYSRD